jgi:Ser/Thr protein kinase RdoA (MazF antagonist)
MTEPVAGPRDVDSAARQVLVTEWGLTLPLERIEVGVNKATWRAGDYWLACDYPRMTDQVMRMQALLTQLASSARMEFSVPRLVPAPHGAVVQAHGRAWWLTEHVDGRQPDPRDPADTGAVAAGLARLHTALRDVPSTLAVSADNLVSLFETGGRLAADPRFDFSPDDRKTADEATAVVCDRLEALQRAGTQLIHGDPSNPNLRVKDNPVHLTGALDWDYARVDLALADVATVAQTVVFRSGTAAPLEALNAMVAAYRAAGGVPLTLDDVLVGLVMVKFESIAHHGARYLRGETDQAMVSGQVDKIRIALDLHAAQ